MTLAFYFPMRVPKITAGSIGCERGVLQMATKLKGHARYFAEIILPHVNICLCAAVAAGFLTVAAVSYCAGRGAFESRLAGIAAAGLPSLATLVVLNATLAIYRDWLTESGSSQELEYQQLLREAAEGFYENVFEMNITHNCAGSEETRRFFESLGISGDTPYTEALKVIAEKQIKDEFVGGYLDTFDPQNVLRIYRSGLSDMHYDFMITADGDNYYWMRIRARLMYWDSDRSLRMITYRQNIDSEKRRESRILRMAQSDSLTGLYNRDTVERRIKELLEFSLKREECFHALLMIDIDHFKSINDSFGHAAGDHAIREFAAVIRKMFRSTDICGRIGGDEFIVLIRDVPSREWLEGYMRTLFDGQMRRISVEGTECQISASAGIAIYPHAGKNFETLYRNADTALYLAKDSGRGTYKIYDAYGGVMF